MRSVSFYVMCAIFALATIGCSDNNEHTPATYELRTLTFEDNDTKFAPYSLDYSNKQIVVWSDLVDNKQYDGALLYGDYQTHTYHWSDDGNTELAHSFLTPFWGGGAHAISNYVIEDYSKLPEGYTGWYELQLATPNGGHNASKNYAVHNGYLDSFNEGIYNAELATLSFNDGVERVVDHMWVTNISYTLNSLCYGNDYCPKASDSTMLTIIAEGYNSMDQSVGVAKFALCDKGVLIKDWQRFDLSSLGKVMKITFNFEASDDLKGDYGLLCPAYFAYDDIAVRFER